MPFYDGSGSAVRLGPELGRGAEGAIFEVVGRPDLVAKRYHQPVSSSKARKLELMPPVNTERLRQVCAWPQTVLYTGRNGSVQGFLMQRAEGHEAHELYGVRSRRVNFEQADYRFLVRTAANIARAFAVVHAHGHIIGDVNQKGVFISPKAAVRLLDCDSFQVRIGGEVFRCAVGFPDYTPPELQGRRLADVERTADHDAFGLAVMVFHLLFMGRHPFAGRYAGAGQMPIHEAIREHRFAYGAGAPTRQMQPPPHTPPLESASPPLANLFERAFTSVSGRPSPAEWVEALVAFEQSLRPCSARTHHTYWRGLTSCPWCAIESASGVLLFPVPHAVEGAPVGAGFDLGLVWARIEQVRTPPPVPPINLPVAQPSSGTRRVQRQRALVRGAGVVAGATLAVLGVALFAAYSNIFGLLPVWIGWMVGSNAWRWKSKELIALESAAKQTRQRFDAAMRSAQQAGGEDFAAKRRELEEARRQLMGLGDERRRTIERFKREAEERQRERYLSRYSIARCDVEGIGPGRKQMLISYGIDTAAEVSRHTVRSVPGFGSTLTNRMTAWRRRLERGFRFDPAQTLHPDDVAQLDADLTQKQGRLQLTLQRGAMELDEIRHRAVVAQEHHLQQARAAASSAAQADADLKLIGS